METKSKLHIGIIMDGNGRWATNQGKPRLFGHARGVEVVTEIVRGAIPMNIGTITLFAFAIANWKRDKQEVDGLWELFSQFMQTTAQELVAEGVKVVFIGNREGLPESVRTLATALEENSSDNSTFLLQIALNYDGVDEVARMVQRTIKKGVVPEQVDARYILQHLDTQADNDPDIVIRTGMKQGGEQFSYWRSSSFLPLQSAQSVCVGTTTLWPDFLIDEVKEIISFADPDNRLFGGQRQTGY